MRTRRIIAVTVAALTALALAACGSSSNSGSASTTGGSGSSTAGSSSTGSVAGGTINGAGSTLAAPIYQQWGSVLKGQGLTINYNPVGSGAGVTQLEGGTVDFAGSDPALKPTDTA